MQSTCTACQGFWRDGHTRGVPYLFQRSVVCVGIFGNDLINHARGNFGIRAGIRPLKAICVTSFVSNKSDNSRFLNTLVLTKKTNFISRLQG